jgi:hypothetical protein
VEGEEDLTAEGAKEMQIVLAVVGLSARERFNRKGAKDAKLTQRNADRPRLIGKKRPKR